MYVTTDVKFAAQVHFLDAFFSTKHFISKTFILCTNQPFSFTALTRTQTHTHTRAHQPPFLFFCYVFVFLFCQIKRHEIAPKCVQHSHNRDTSITAWCSRRSCLYDVQPRGGASRLPGADAAIERQCPLMYRYTTVG